jgi:hypothetical protein
MKGALWWAAVAGVCNGILVWIRAAGKEKKKPPKK